MSNSLRPHEPTVCQASMSNTNSQSLPKLMSIESVMPSNHLILCCPLLFLPSIPPSIRVFSNESALHIRWPKYWSFSFNIRPSNEHPGLIYFRIDWLDLLAVQGTLKSLLQHHSYTHLNLTEENTQRYSLMILEVRSLKSFSLGQSQGVGQTGSFRKLQGRTCFLSVFQI